MKVLDTYTSEKVFDFPNARVTVRFPELSPEERGRRMREIKRAAENLLKEGAAQVG